MTCPCRCDNDCMFKNEFLVLVYHYNLLPQVRVPGLSVFVCCIKNLFYFNIQCCFKLISDPCNVYFSKIYSRSELDGPFVRVRRLVRKYPA